MARYIDADKAIRSIAECFLDFDDCLVESATECNAMIDLAIDKIKEQPTADVVEVTSGKYDCVSREKVRDLLHEYMNNEDFTIGHLDDCYCEMPSLDVRENVKGEWVEQQDEPFASSYYCSNCKEQATVDLYGEYVFSNYCPNCGADMSQECNT